MSYIGVENVLIELYRYIDINLFIYLILLISITYKIFINLFKLFGISAWRTESIES